MQIYQKYILIVLGVILGGVLGGLIFQMFVFPYLLANPYFSQFQLVRDFKEGKVIINTKEQIIIQENAALQNAVEKVLEAVVGIRTVTASGTILNGSGFIATTDGTVITLAELAPSGANVSVILDGEPITPKVVKRDFKNNLALLKIPAQNLKTCGFCNAKEVKLAERVFLLGIVPGTYGISTNEGIIKSFDENSIKTSISDSNFLRGSPLFNIDGNLVGMNIVDANGKISAIPVSKIKTFAGF